MGFGSVASGPGRKLCRKTPIFGVNWRRFTAKPASNAILEWTGTNIQGKRALFCPCQSNPRRVVGLSAAFLERIWLGGACEGNRAKCKLARFGSCILQNQTLDKMERGRLIRVC